MMLPLLLLLQEAGAPARPDPETAQEIVVIGERLKAWRASIRFREGGAQCKIKRSTGDAEVDRIGCAAVERCWPEFHAGFEATRAKGVTAQDRKARTAELNQALGSCVMARRDAMIAALAERRAGGSGS